MKYVKWGVPTLLLLVGIAFLHYTLPQHDVVRIADTYEIRVDLGENSAFFGEGNAGNAVSVNRDIFFIQSFYENGKPMVYRNEDTSWGWPPYFKFDTSNLQAEATDLKSTKETPQWAIVTHYGWRIIYWSIYPNAISVRAVDGPDVTVIPWFNIIFLTIMVFIALSIYFRIRKFKRNRIDPVMDDVADNIGSAGESASEAWDNVGEKAAGASTGFKALLKRWFG